MRLTIIIGLVAIVGVVSCGEHDRVTAPHSDGPVIAANVWLIDTLPGVRIEATSDSTYRLSFAASALNIAPGDLIVGTADGGYLKRIVSLSPGDGAIDVLTENAALTDAVIAGGFQSARSFQIVGEPESDATLFDVAYLAEGVSWTDEGIDLSGLPLFAGLVDGTELTAVVARGLLAINPSIDIGATITGGQRQTLHGIAGGWLDLDCMLSLETDGAVAHSDSVHLARFTHTTTEYLGDLPIVHTITLRLDALFEVEAHSPDTLAFGADGRIDFLLGGRTLAEDWLPIWLARPHMEDAAVTWPGHGDLTFRFVIRPTLEATVYARPGFRWSTDIALSFRGDRTVPRTRRWTVAAGAAGQVYVYQAPIDPGTAPWSTVLSEPDHTIAVASVPILDTWESVLGGGGDDEAHAVAALPDGGFVVVGATESFGYGASDVLAIRVNEMGEVVWQQTYGGTDVDIGYAVAVTPDGGCVIAGESYSSAGGNQRAHVVRIDAAGNLQWERRLGITSHARSIAVTVDGGYIIAGQGRLKMPNTFGLYLVKIDAEGNVMWETTFPDIIIGLSVVPLPSGAYAVSGYANTYRGADMALLRVDNRGEMVWSRSFGGSGPDVAASVITGGDGNLVLLGYSQSFGPSPTVFYMLKTTLAGNVEWRRLFGDPAGDAHNVGRSLTRTPDGGYLVAGRSVALADDLVSRVYLIRTDSFGNKLWERFYGGENLVDARAIAAAPYGGYIVAGWSKASDNADKDVYLLRVSDDGAL